MPPSVPVPDETNKAATGNTRTRETRQLYQPPHRRQDQPESSNGPGDEGKGKDEKPEKGQKGIRAGFELYVPKGRIKQSKGQPKSGTNYNAMMELGLKGTTKLAHKGYDEIELGEFIIGPCHGLSIFAERTASGQVTQKYNFKFSEPGRQFPGADTKHHPQIVIMKNNNGSLQTVMTTTFGISEGGKLEDRMRPNLDVTACKYYVPVDGRPHEDNHEDKGQPDFTIKYTKDPLITLAGDKGGGWAFTFAYFNIYPASDNNKAST